MKIQFLGGSKTVTGSKYLLTVQSKQILIDCGLFQGRKEIRQRNWDNLPINPGDIDAVILTHAHIDHSGYLPLFVKKGFKGKIFCTHGTFDLCSILLPDSGHIHEEDARLANQSNYSKHHPALPLYTVEDARNALNFFNPVDFNQLYDLFNLIQFKFLPAGHIIGSAMVSIQAEGKSILFTGDMGRPNHLIMKPPQLVQKTDYLVCESTYGDRQHQASDPLVELEEIINLTVKNNGKVIIPAFAVGRSQDILYYIFRLKQSHRIEDVPVFLDSPMAQDASDLMCRYNDEHRLGSKVCESMCHMAIYTTTAEASKQIDTFDKPAIIISASGMLEGGRILHHLKVFLGDQHNSIILTGYQDESTRGYQLATGSTSLKIHGEQYPVNAKVYQIQSLSAHADSLELIAWMQHFKYPPIKTFITHGNEVAAASLKQKIESELNWKCIVPNYLDTEDLK